MIQVGIAGIGYMGMVHYLAYRRLNQVRVRAICEEDPERLAGDWRSIRGNFGMEGRRMDLTGVARYARFEELIADPKLDLIDICLPPAQHAAAAVAALRAGKHVLCEKPIALKLADADRALSAAQSAGRMLLVGHVLPFFPEYRFVYQTAATAKYGRLRSGNFKRVIADPRGLADYFDAETTGGPMIDLHIHDAHFIRMLCGMPTAVQTVGRMRGSVAEWFQTQFLFDNAGLSMTATGGAIAQQGRPFTHGFEIHLERATLLFDFANLGRQSGPVMPLTVLTDNGRVLRPKLSAGDPLDAFAAELHEVVRSLRTGEPSIALDARLARDALTLCHRETQSLLRRRPVRV